VTRPRRALSATALRRWRAVHTWSSLVCTVFLLVLCLTGLPLIFQDEIGDALGTPHSAEVAAGTPALPLDTLLASAQTRYPGDATNFIALPDDDPGMATIGLIDHTGGAFHWVKYDRHTGTVIDDQREGGTQKISFMDVMLAIHGSLTVGLPGTLLLGVMGLLFVAALVSGVMLYGPFTPRTGAGSLRLRGNRRLRWLDLHNVIGMVLLAWLGVVGLTGVINTLEKPLFGLWQATDVAKLLADTASSKGPVAHAAPVGSPLNDAMRTAQRGKSTQPVQDAISEALKRHPNETVASILFPSEARHHPHHYLVWLHGDKPLTRELLVPVLIDATSGAVLDGAKLPGYLTALEVSRPLHFGDYGGLPLKLLWFVFDLGAILVLITGVYLWIGRRRTRNAPVVAEVIT
jgi:uncharacterized iron-regulated membrane protein